MRAILLVYGLVLGLGSLAVAAEKVEKAPVEKGVDKPASDKTNKKPTLEQSEISMKQPEVRKDGNSRHHRANKNYVMTAQPVGIGPSYSISHGVTFGKHLSPDSLILFEIMGFERSSSWLWSKEQTKTNSYGIHYKQFLGNSFYVRGGVDHRRVNYHYRFDSILGSSVDTEIFKGYSTALSFAVGNQWQWSSFTLGCDWFGYVFPFQSSTTYAYNSRENDEYFRNRFAQDQDEHLKDTMPMGVRFYLGASF